MEQRCFSRGESRIETLWKNGPLVRFPVNRNAPLFFHQHHPPPLLCVCLSLPFSLLVLFSFFFPSFFWCYLFWSHDFVFILHVVLCGYVIAWLWSLSPVFECRLKREKYDIRNSVRIFVDVCGCARIAFEIWKFRFTIPIELPFLWAAQLRLQQL